MYVKNKGLEAIINKLFYKIINSDVILTFDQILEIIIYFKDNTKNEDDMDLIILEWTEKTLPIPLFKERKKNKKIAKIIRLMDIFLRLGTHYSTSKIKSYFDYINTLGFMNKNIKIKKYWKNINKKFRNELIAAMN